MERDITWYTIITGKRYFNSHAHVERDGCGQAKGTNEKNFNSHAHVERDLKSIPSSILSMNFNSHAHVERDYKYWNALFHSDISTHTLTWSVTGEEIDIDVVEIISTHTLTWSVTHIFVPFG